MDAKRLLLVIGLPLFAAGVVIGFLPIKVDGVRCGSAFHGTDEAQVAVYSDALSGGQIGNASAVNDCDSKRSDWRTPAIALLVIGAGVGGSALFVRSAVSACEKD